MRVEQRIGRLDRYGQLNPAVVVVSLVLEDTIEERILLRLYERIRVFEESIGELEPILGNVVTTLERQVFSRNLTPDEQVVVANLVDRAIENQRAEMSSFSTRMDEFLGSDDLIEQVHSRARAGLVVDANDVREAVEWFCRNQQSGLTSIPTHEGLFSLRRSPTLASALQRFSTANAGCPWTEEHADFADRLRREDVWVVFDGGVANSNPGVHFIGSGHPLTRLAVERTKDELAAVQDALVYRVRVPVATDQPVRVFLFLFRYSYEAATPGFQLFPVACSGAGDLLDEQFAWQILGSLARAERTRAVLDDEEFELCEQLAFSAAVRERDRFRGELESRNDAQLIARKSSLVRNFESRIRKRLEWSRTARDARIRTMRSAEARHLQEALEGRLERLAQTRVAVSFDLVARMLVENQSA